MSKKRLSAGQLALKVSRLLQQSAPSGTLESGRVGVRQPSVEMHDLESLVQLLAPGKQQAARAQLRSVKERAMQRDQIERAEVERLERQVDEAERLEMITRDIAAQRRSQIPAQVQSQRASGLEIVIASEGPVHHSYVDRHGRPCDTDKWFTACFLVYEMSLDATARGGSGDPWFGLEGSRFRCYYPNSDTADFRAILSSGSPGYWLHRWGQKRNYVKF